ncbi:YheC/YheD family protein [Nanoarchaeota archaeon]
MPDMALHADIKTKAGTNHTIYLSARHTKQLGFKIGETVRINYADRKVNVKIKKSTNKDLIISSDVLNMLKLHANLPVIYDRHKVHGTIELYLRRPVIGVLAKKTGPRENPFKGNSNFFKALTERGKEIGVDVIFFSSKDFNHRTGNIRPWFWNPLKSRWLRKKKTIPLPDAIYDRDPNVNPIFRQELEQIRPFVNPHEFSELTNDRHQTHKALHKSGIRHNTKTKQPKTSHASPKNIETFVNQYGHAFLKHNSNNKGTVKCRKKKHDPKGNHHYELAYDLRQGTSFVRKHIIARSSNLNNKLNQVIDLVNPKSSSEDYVVQQPIEAATYENRSFEVRVTTHRNRNSRFTHNRSTRSWNKKGKATNHDTDTLINDIWGNKNKVQKNIDKTVDDTVKAIEKHLGKRVGEVGVDICLDNKGTPYIINLDSHADNRDIAIEHPLQYALRLAKKKHNSIST